VLNDSKATSDAYTYTFFPYSAEIQSIKAKIKEVVPKGAIGIAPLPLHQLVELVQIE
jgi:hypothetical protein